MNPNTYDALMAPLELGLVASLRRELLAYVKSPVLEIGVGTGANLRWYPAPACVYACDRDAAMLSLAEKKVRENGNIVRLGMIDAQHLSFADATFRTVVTSLVFCTVEDAVTGLRELKRVLQPGGELLMLEHVRPANPVGWFFDALNPAWRAIADDCNINRRTAENVEAAGFRIVDRQVYVAGIINVIRAFT